MERTRYIASRGDAFCPFSPSAEYEKSGGFEDKEGYDYGAGWLPPYKRDEQEDYNSTAIGDWIVDWYGEFDSEYALYKQARIRDRDSKGKMGKTKPHYRRVAGRGKWIKVSDK